jgi:hypothetical protein
MPRVISQPILRFEDVLQEMQESTTLRDHDADLAIQRLVKVMKKYVSAGFKVETPLGYFRATLHGTLHTQDEDFYPALSTNNHEIEFCFRPNRDLAADMVKDVETERISDFSMRHPRIYSLRNLSRPEAADVKNGDVISITGVNLKSDREAEDEGAFWTDEAGNSTRSELMIDNTSSNLKFLVPALTAGNYTLTISSRLGNHQLRSSYYEEVIPFSP